MTEEQALALDRQWETIRNIVDEYRHGADDVGPYTPRNPMQANWGSSLMDELEEALDAFERIMEQSR